MSVRARPPGPARATAPPRPLRVHALVDSLACGGAQAILCELAEVAPAAEIALSVGYLTEGPGASLAPRLRAAGVEPVPIGASRLLARGARSATVEHLARVGPDVLHTHMGYADFLGGRAARRLGVPWVSTVHAMRWNGTFRERMRSELIGAVRSGATRVITVSEQARSAYLAEFRADPRRVVVVPNGIGDRRARGAGRAIRAELGIGGDERVVAVVSPLRREKGHARALASLAILGAARPVRVILAGDGPDREWVMRHAGQLGADVTATGHRDDVMAILDAADALLHTPETDALPTNLIEAAAAGVPVVATATGGVPEVVEDGVTGILLPHGTRAEEIAAALERLLAGDDARRRMGEAARGRFERSFQASGWAQRLRAVYECAMAEA